MHRRGGDVRIRQHEIKQLRHFYVLPKDGAFDNADKALEAIADFAKTEGKGYIRLRIKHDVMLPSDFNQRVYDHLSAYDDEVRYNPKHIWTDAPVAVAESPRPMFDVADLQQMTNPLDFIEKTIDQYPGLDIDTLRDAFMKIEEELSIIKEEETKKSKKK
jgi:exonuclease SbcD